MTQNEVYEYLSKLGKVEILAPCPHCGANRLVYGYVSYDPDCGEWVVEEICIECCICSFSMSLPTNLRPSEMASFDELDSVVEKLNKLIGGM